MIDEIDVALLDALLADGRGSLDDVARATDLSTATVTDHVIDLERDGVIDGYEPRLDYAELGYPTVAVFAVEVNLDFRSLVVKRLVEHRRLVTIYEVTGNADVIAVGRYEDESAADDHAHELRGIPGVTRIRTTAVREVRRDYAPPELDADLVSDAGGGCVDEHGA